MRVCTIGLKVWNKDGYGRREYVPREMYNLKLKWAIAKAQPGGVLKGLKHPP